jgi:hypothetical protein
MRTSPRRPSSELQARGRARALLSLPRTGWYGTPGARLQSCVRPCGDSSLGSNYASYGKGSPSGNRIGRRVRVRRADLDRILAQSATVAPDPQASPVAPAEARELLAEALERAQRLLGRRSAARRGELAEALQDLSHAVAAALDALGDSPGEPTTDDA